MSPSYNVVEGNYIGTDITGTVSLSNSFAGVSVIGGGVGNVIGGSTAGAGNLISGNDGPNVWGGIFITSSQDVTIQGNRIGTTADGSAALPNAVGIVVYQGSSNITIGGTSSISGGQLTGAGNLISGNAGYGVDTDFGGAQNPGGIALYGNWIGTDITGNAALPNGLGGVDLGTENTVGSTLAGQGNVISGNTNAGVRIDGPGNVVQGNYIGTNAAGTGALGNGERGVDIESAPGTEVSGNVISANGDAGVYVGSADNTLIENNDIGTDSTGNVGLGNTGRGIYVQGTNLFTVTGTVLSGNLVSDNGTGVSALSGIRLEDDMGTVVQGNMIGTNAAGTAALGNGLYGLRLVGSTDDQIGGAGAGQGNVISGNGSDGIHLDTGSSGNLIEGNDVGTNAAGTVALANGSNGIQIASGSTGNTIGGTAAGAANLISGNAAYGLQVDGSTTTGDTLSSNYVGTGAGGSGSVPNSSGALEITNSASVTVTGTLTGSGVTSISSGTLQVGNGGTTGALPTGSITDNGALVFDFSNTIAVSNAISGTGTVTLTSTGAAITQSAAITAATLVANASTGITLTNAANAVSSFTASNSTSGNISLINAAALSVTGITQSGSGSVSVSATGSNTALTVNGNVTGAGGSIALQATGNLTVATNQTINSGTGALTLFADSGAVGVGTLSINGTAQVYGANITLRGAAENIATTATVGNGVNPSLGTTPSATLTGLNGPHDLAFDASGNLFVSNEAANTVSKFPPAPRRPASPSPG